MYAGHLGISLMAKGLNRKSSFVLLVVSTMMIDVLEAAIGIVRLEIPLGLGPHSLIGAAVTAVIVLLISLAARQNIAQSLFNGSIALSHIAADFVTSGLLVWPRGPVVGLRLYGRPGIDFAIEICVILGGWMFYRNSLRSQDKKQFAVWAIPAWLVFCQAIYYFIIK